MANLPRVGVEAVIEGMAKFQADSQKINKSVDDTGKAFDSAGAKAQAMGLRFDEASGRWRVAAGRFASNAELISAGIKKADDSATTTATKFGGLNLSIGNLIPSFSGLTPFVTSLGASLLNLGTTIISGAISALVSLGAAILKVGLIAGGATLASIVALGAGLATFAVGGIKQAIDLDQQVANIAATMGATRETAGTLKDELKGLALDLSLNPNLTVDVTQAGQAIEVLAANGALATDEFGKLTQSSKDLAVQTVALANATGSDFATAATIATDAANIFGLEANEMGKAVDGAAGIMNASKFDADDYALALANAGPVTAEMGVSLEDFNTVIAGTASNFASGSDAGTSFKTLMQRLANPTKEVAAEMEKYGISLFDADGKMRDMKDVVADLNQVFFGTVTLTSQVGGATKEQAAAAEKATGKMDDLKQTIKEQATQLQILNDDYAETLKWFPATSNEAKKVAARIDSLTYDYNKNLQTLSEYEGAIATVNDAKAETVTTTQQLTEAQRAELAATIGGADGARILLGLAGMTADEFDALSESVNRSGQGLEAAALRVDTVKGAIDIFRGVIQALGIQVGDKFLPLLKQMAINFTQFATQSGPMVVDFFGRIADGIGSAITAISAGVQKVSGAFQRFGVRGATVSILGQLGLDPTQIAGVMGVVDQVTGVIDKISGAFERFGVKGATVSILGQLGMDPETIGIIRTTFDSIIEKIGVLQQIYAQFGAQGAGVSLLSMLGLSSETIALITTSIQSVMDGLNSLATWWTATWPAVQAAALTGWEVLQGIFAGFQTALTPVLTQLQTQFTQVFGQISQIVSSFGISWSDVWNALLTATGIVAAGIGAAIVGIIGVVAGLATGIAEGISAAITMFQNLASNVAGIFTGLTTIVVGWIETFKALLAGDFAGAWEGFKIVLDGAVTFWSNMWGGMITVAVGTLDIMSSSLSGFVEGVVGFFQGLYDQLVGHSIVPNLVNEIVKWFSGLPQKILTGLGNLGEKIVAPFTEAASSIKDALGNLTEDVLPLLSEGIDTVIESIKNFISSMKEAISTVADFVVPDILMPGSPPPLAYALMDIASGANLAAAAMDNISSAANKYAQAGRDVVQRIASGAGLTGGSIQGAISEQLGLSARMFKQVGAAFDEHKQMIDGSGTLSEDERNAAETAIREAYSQSYGAILAGKAGASDFVEAFKNNLRGKTFMNESEWAETVRFVEGQAANIVNTIRSQFGPLTLEMKQQALSVVSSLNSIAGSFAETLKGQLGAFQKAKEESIKWAAQNKNLTATLADQDKELITLQADLLELTTASDKDTEAIARKEEAIAKLIAKMEENREVITKNEQAMADYRKELARAVSIGNSNLNPWATGEEELAGDLAMIELLQQFLDSGIESLRLLGNETEGIFANTGLSGLINRNFAQEELNRLLEEQAQIERDIAQQQQAQKDLASLQSQLDLLKQGQALGINVFEGLQFGLGASASDLLAATNRLAQAMIDEINSSFEVHSPSAVMIDIARQIMAGFPVGFSQMMPRVTGSLSDMMGSLSRVVAGAAPVLNAQLSASVAGPISPMMAGAMGGRGDTYNYNTYQLGGNSFYNQTDDAIFEQRVIRTIQKHMS